MVLFDRKVHCLAVSRFESVPIQHRKSLSDQLYGSVGIQSLIVHLRREIKGETLKLCKLRFPIVHDIGRNFWKCFLPTLPDGNAAPGAELLEDAQRLIETRVCHLTLPFENLHSLSDLVMLCQPVASGTRDLRPEPG